MKQRRALAQGWTCTWCGHPLPVDLKDTHQDHVIPSAVAIAVTGRIINDEWNMDVLHAACNRVKGDSLTPRAIALAAAHGISLRAA
jgi:5-methylcytosine-specific restriction endonuclease McrA